MLNHLNNGMGIHIGQTAPHEPNQILAETERRGETYFGARLSRSTGRFHIVQAFRLVYPRGGDYNRS